MAATTYTELVRSVPIWMIAQNNDLVAEMPNIVLEAHNHLIALLDHDLFRTRLAPIPVPTTGEIDLSTMVPPVLEVRSVNITYAGGTVPLGSRDTDFLTALYPRNRPGRPRYYGEVDGPLKLQVFPSPPMIVSATIFANVEPVPLSPTNDTNIMAQRAPLAVEKTTLYQAAFFMKEWETAEKYNTEMMAAITEANTLVTRRRRDETENRPIDNVNRVGS